MSKSIWIVVAVALVAVATAVISLTVGRSQGVLAAASAETGKDYFRAVYSPLHFKPAAETASNEECLACHREVLDDKVREKSPAGVVAANAKAWYQRTPTYVGDQETFHRRHMETPMAKRLMNLQCNTCHQGHEPRDEAPGTSATAVPQDTRDITLRKQVNPEVVCLKCHGQFSFQNMGLPGPWHEIREQMGNNCLLCHSNIRTSRHQVTYLHPEVIEAEAKTNGGETCYGCHGGRSWYRISYPYPRHPWPDMPTETPEWAKGRSAESEARFVKPAPAASAVPAPTAAR